MAASLLVNLKMAKSLVKVPRLTKMAWNTLETGKMESVKAMGIVNMENATILTPTSRVIGFLMFDRAKVSLVLKMAM